MIVYFPITANILTVGHIRCLRWLNKNYSGVVVGLLTSEALKGYKKEIVPFDERYEIFQIICDHLGFPLVPQNSLNPEENIKMFKPDAIASGDGFEPCEIEASKKYKLELINIKLPKNHSVTNIINKIKNEKTNSSIR